jgi:hypothetical protein
VLTAERHSRRGGCGCRIMNHQANSLPWAPAKLQLLVHNTSKRLEQANAPCTHLLACMLLSCGCLVKAATCNTKASNVSTLAQTSRMLLELPVAALLSPQTAGALRLSRPSQGARPDHHWRVLLTAQRASMLFQNGTKLIERGTSGDESGQAFSRSTEDCSRRVPKQLFSMVDKTRTDSGMMVGSLLCGPMYTPEDFYLS